MKLFHLHLVAMTFLLLPSVAAGQVAVEILDAVPSVFSFEPVGVLYEVRNEGGEPVVIPEGCTHEGATLEVGLRGGELSTRRTVSDCLNTRLIWIPSGGRWLFYQAVILGQEGIFEIEAVLRSPGECMGQPIGPDGKRIEPVRPFVWGGRPYDCWRGEARSQRTEVKVKVPDADVDLAAAEKLQIVPDWNYRAGLILNIRTLNQDFPESHYTYASRWVGGGALAMLSGVTLQPDNPLNPWMAAAMAEALARRNHRCAPPRIPHPLGEPPDLQERYERVIAAYPPPEPVKEYLLQVGRELAAEECAEKESVTEETGG
jgi:hypothetical protein